MKLTKKLEHEVRKVLDTYWDNYARGGDVEAMASLLDDEYIQIGSAPREVFFNKKDAVKFLHDTIDDVAGKAELRNRTVRITPVGELILVSELMDIYVLSETKWVFYSRFRASTLLKNKRGTWKIVHQHSSVPDLKVEEGGNLAIDRIAAENLELREAVKRRTVELEHKNRELEIESCLERVRTQAMAMRKPDDLLGVCAVLFKELRTLDFSDLRNTMIDIYNDDGGSFLNYDYSDALGKSITNIHYNIHPVVEKHVKLIRSGKDAFQELVFSGKELEDWKEFRRRNGERDDPRLDTFPALYYYFYSIGVGDIGISTFQSITQDKLEVLKRFRNVFDFAYRRYMDVAQAEAQAREAQVETALERVRSRTMAMQNSRELAETTGVLYSQFIALGFAPKRCVIGIIDPVKHRAEFWFTSRDGKVIPGADSIPLTEQENLVALYRAWRERREHFTFTVVGAAREAWTNYLVNKSGMRMPEYQANTIDREQLRTEPAVFNSGFFTQGFVMLHTVEQLDEQDILVLKRFAAVFEQSYTRFLDLQKAEAQAREAQIEAALEKVRSRTLAMQRSEELAETAAVLFKQLITLGIAPNRLYIAIIKDESGNAEFWITDEDGSKVSSGFAANLHDNGFFQTMLEGWQQRKKSITIDMQGKELQEYFQYLSSLKVPFKGGLSQTRRVQNIAYFSRGFIGIASPDKQPEETTTLLERFAAVFNLTLTRFNDLKLAEAQAHQAHLDLIQLQTEKKRAEDALSELSATQAQLVQQEKLASLGQLTAGIAHEIKNPLNFVTNFSSVSVELLDEVMQEINSSAPELRNGDIPQLLGDIKTNLTKIIEHGTRADGIVKSMLQHSRGGSGRQEPTDLNAMIKEYANLAFHGMRAGKNPINVDIALDLDQSIGKVSVIAEDFSRVIINLCQNAFDAMREKVNSGDKKSGSYLPKLTVRTRRETDKIIVEVGDNGPGIPDAIKDKILQPFFTTKKGTQGTGLGLSITHDIVKAHGGSVTIESSEVAGTVFRIVIPSNGG